MTYKEQFKNIVERTTPRKVETPKPVTGVNAASAPQRAMTEREKFLSVTGLKKPTTTIRQRQETPLSSPYKPEQPRRAVNDISAEIESVEAIIKNAENALAGNAVRAFSPEYDNLNEIIRTNRQRLADLKSEYYFTENEAAVDNLSENKGLNDLYEATKGSKSDVEMLTAILNDRLTPTGNSDISDYKNQIASKYGTLDNATTPVAREDYYTAIENLRNELNAGYESGKSKLVDNNVNFDRLVGYEQILADAAEDAVKQKQYEREARNNPVLSSAKTVIAAPLQGFEFIGTAARNLRNIGKGYEDYVPVTGSNMDITNYVSTTRNAVSKEIEENTDWEIFGQNVASFLYNTGMSIADSATQIAMFGPAATYLMGASAASSSAKEILDRGGSGEQAFWGGLAAGAAEAIFEKFSVDNLLKSKDVKTVRNIIGETLKQAGIEASEEINTELANILFDNVVMGNKSQFNLAVSAYVQQGLSEEEAKKQATLDTLGQVGWAGIGGALSGGGMGGVVNLGNYAATKANNADLDSAALQALRGNVAEIEDDLVSNFGKTGQEIYRTNKPTDGNTTEYYADFARVYHAGLTGTAKPTSRLTASQANAAYKAGKIDASATQVETKGKVESAVAYKGGFDMEDSATADYVNANLSAADRSSIDQISKALGVKVRFADQVSGGNANADISNGVITIEKNNPNPVRFLVGHEITHRLQELAPTEYSALRKQVAKAMTSRSGSAITASVMATQMNYEGHDMSIGDEAAIDEAVADYVGELLQNEGELERFISINRENKSIIERFLDIIRDVISAIKGDTAAVQLRRVERRLSKALGVASEQASVNATKNTAQESGGEDYATTEDGVRYAIKMSFAEQVDAALSYELPKGTDVLVAYTSEILQAVGLQEYPILMTQKHIRDAVRPKSKSNKKYHGLTVETVKSLPEILESPVMILRSLTEENSVVVVSAKRDGDNLPIIVAIKPNGVGKYNRVDVVTNFAMSAYGRTGFGSFIDRTIESGGVLYANKKRTQSLFARSGLKMPQALNKDGFYESNIAQFNPNVNTVAAEPSGNNTRYSLKDSNGKTLSKEQVEFFKDSKVRDENGNLLVVYHGSANNFTVFNGRGNSKFGEYKFADNTVNYFTTAKETAEDFARGMRDDGWSEGNVYKGYVNATNPYVFKDERESDYGYSTANGLKNRELREFEISLFEKNIDKLKWAYDVEEVNEMLLPFNARVKEYEDGEYELYSGGGNFLYSSENFVTSANGFYDLFDDAELLREEILGVSEEYGDDDYYYTTDQVVNLVIAMNKYGRKKYDAVIIDNIFDAKSFRGRVATDVITIKSSNQFKAADNKNPTSDPDIRYSLKDSGSVAREIARIQTEGVKNKRSDADIQADIRNVVETAYANMIEEYGSFDAGETPAREVRVPKKTGKNEKVSQTVRTILEAKATPDEVMPDIERLVADGTFSYEAYGDEQAVKDAEATIKDKGFATAYSDWAADVRKGKVNKANTTLGWVLYNNAVNTGDVKTSLDILTLMIGQQRNAAQALQATRILKKLMPETQLYAVQRSVANLQRDLVKKYGDKAPNLKINATLAENLLNATTETAKANAMTAIYNDIGRQMPSRFVDKWNAWRYLAMLGNLRTHIRNVVGNAAFAPVTMVKNVFATGIEYGAYMASGGKLNRTKGMPTRDLLEAAWGDYVNVRSEIMGEGKYSDSNFANKAIEEGRQIFKNKALEAARKGNSALLDMEDSWFSQPHYANALAQYCKANGITAQQIRNGKNLDAARAYAIKEAQKATYRDTNAFSEFVSKVGKYRGDNKVAKTASVLVEGILPFRKTPANILARGVEYSPIGLLKSVFLDLAQVKKGNMTGAEMIDNISAGLTGTGLLALGVWLASQGIVRGAGEGDEEEKKFAELQGHQEYALELGDGTSVTLDWLAPEALPFFIGVNIIEQIKTNKGKLDMASILSAVSNISEPMLEMSCLQSLNDVLDAVGGVASKDVSALVSIMASAATSYLTQGIPTLLGQAERSTQEERMTTYTGKSKWLTSDMQYFLGSASSKIPVWDFNQIPYIDAWGRTENAGGAAQRAANNFLNPAYTSKVNESRMEKELERLYEATTDGGVLPDRAGKYFNVNKERKDLTAEEYVKYATEKGQLSYSIVSDLVDNEVYKKVADTDKAEMVSLAYEYANAVAKTKVSNYKLDGWIEKAAETTKKYKISPAKYIAIKGGVSNIEGLKDKNGDALDNSKSLLIMQEIYSIKGLTDAQRNALFADFGVGKTVIHYNKALVDQKLEALKKQAK